MTNTRLALQNRLITLISASSVEWENSDFTAPALNVPYYKANLLRGKPENLAIDTLDAEGIGIFQVTLLYPVDAGTLALETKADAIIAHFLGQKLVETDVKVKILSQPYFNMLTPTADRFIGAVSIPYEVTNI